MCMGPSECTKWKDPLKHAPAFWQCVSLRNLRSRLLGREFINTLGSKPEIHTVCMCLCVCVHVGGQCRRGGGSRRAGAGGGDFCSHSQRQPGSTHHFPSSAFSPMWRHGRTLARTDLPPVRGCSNNFCCSLLEEVGFQNWEAFWLLKWKKTRASLPLL